VSREAGTGPRKVMVSRRSADARAKIAMGLGAAGVVLSIVVFVIGLATAAGEGGDSGGSSSLRPHHVVAVTLDGAPL
jgi:hypothetical protein